MGKFAGQELAFVVSSSAVGPIMAHMAAEAGFELTAGPLPHNGDERYAGRLLGGQSLYLTADLPKEKEDGALAFLQHLLNPRNAVLRQRAGGTLPVTVPAREQSAGEGWFEQHPYFRAAVDQVDASDGTPAATGPVVGDLNGIQDVLTAAMHDVLTAGADPRARFAAATAEAQGLLDRHNAACLADPPVTPDTLAIG
jgi:sn-glycerol 3-phosphate transport system substrate-binding protein